MVYLERSPPPARSLPCPPPPPTTERQVGVSVLATPSGAVLPAQARMCCMHAHACTGACACVCTYVLMCVCVCEYTHAHTHPPRDESAASHLARRGARRCTRRIVFATLFRHAGASSYQRDQVLIGNHREQLQKEKSRPKPHHRATRWCVLIRGVA